MAPDSLKSFWRRIAEYQAQAAACADAAREQPRYAELYWDALNQQTSALRRDLQDRVSELLKQGPSLAPALAAWLHRIEAETTAIPLQEPGRERWSDKISRAEMLQRTDAMFARITRQVLRWIEQGVTVPPAGPLDLGLTTYLQAADPSPRRPTT